jgi:hypothetical protein
LAPGTAATIIDADAAVVAVCTQEVDEMRNAARLKMGYYPLPVSEAAKLVRCFPIQDQRL